MNTKSELVADYKSVALQFISWLFGILVLATGIINTFWGNDTGFGIFLILLSFAFYPPVDRLARNIAGFGIPGILKVVLAVFIIWAAIGVGELPAKVDLVLQDF